MIFHKKREATPVVTWHTGAAPLGLWVLVIQSFYFFCQLACCSLGLLCFLELTDTDQVVLSFKLKCRVAGPFGLFHSVFFGPILNLSINFFGVPWSRKPKSFNSFTHNVLVLLSGPVYKTMHHDYYTTFYVKHQIYAALYLFKYFS